MARRAVALITYIVALTVLSFAVWPVFMEEPPYSRAPQAYDLARGILDYASMLDLDTLRRLPRERDIRNDKNRIEAMNRILCEAICLERTNFSASLLPGLKILLTFEEDVEDVVYRRTPGLHRIRCFVGVPGGYINLQRLIRLRGERER